MRRRTFNAETAEAAEEIERILCDLHVLSVKCCLL